MRYIILTLPLLFFSLTIQTGFAQQSGKVKSKERFRERGSGDKQIQIRYSTQINSEYTDKAPAWYQNGLVFVSSRAKHGIKNKKGETLPDIFFSPFDRNGDPTEPSPFSFTLNSELGEESVCFTQDWKTIYFTRTNRKEAKDGDYKSGIYEGYDGYPDWKGEKMLPFVEINHHYIHPALSRDGSRMFFASDKPGGEGGFDLYYSDKTPAGWGPAVSLGPNINTPANEIYPFMSQTGTLYFSCNGRNSLGGYDIFFVNNPTDNPGDIVNLDAPFNTQDDETGLIVDPEGIFGFFARNISGNTDIYRFEMPRGIEGTNKPKEIPTRIIVTDAKTGKRIQGADVRILRATQDGFISSKEDFYNFDLLPVQNNPNALSLQLVRKDAKELGAADEVTNAAGEVRKDFVETNWYYIFVSSKGYSIDDRMFLGENIIDGKIEFSLREAPKCFRAGGIVATEEFGTRIANAILRFVNKQTGKEERVRTNINGQYDACLPSGGDYAVYVLRDGYKDYNFDLVANLEKEAFDEIRLTPTKIGATAESALPLATGLQEGSVIVLDQIFYEYNKATLNQSAVRYLEALSELLQRYPEMEVDLLTHTDTRGDASLNMELTVERAKNAKIYLEHLGVSGNRVNPIGKGETEPRNRCTEGVECSDKEHQQNNRIEVKIRKLGGKTFKP